MAIMPTIFFGVIRFYVWGRRISDIAGSRWSRRAIRALGLGLDRTLVPARRDVEHDLLVHSSYASAPASASASGTHAGWCVQTPLRHSAQIDIGAPLHETSYSHPVAGPPNVDGHGIPGIGNVVGQGGGGLQLGPGTAHRSHQEPPPQ
jgi:hypothetical protein